MGFIIGKTDAIKGENSRREVFSPDARRTLKKEFSWRERALAAPVRSADGGGQYNMADRIQDPAEMAKQARDYRKNYDRGAPIKLDPRTRSEMWKKAKALKDQFVVGMLSKDEVHPVSQKEIVKDGIKKLAVVADRDKMNDGKVIARNTAWYKKNQGNLREYKRIMRVLEPDDPNVTDVEKFRPKTRRKK